jgi:hypothetical protein
MTTTQERSPNMTLGSFGRWIRRGAAALVVALGGAGATPASDNPPVVVAGPAVMTAAPCQSCTQPSGGCATGKCAHFLHKPCKPYQTTLCPGACFGYFQTQWNRWEDVCPHPYQGIGLSDAPKPVTPSVTPPAPLGPPTKTDPKLPPIDPKLPTLDPKKGGLPQPQPLPIPGKDKN